jgi:L-malate glycosyltransferase
LSINILHISSAEDIAGGEIHLINLVVGLKNDGHQVFLAHRKNSAILDRIKNTDIKTFALPLCNSMDFISSLKLSKIIKLFKIDIVHAHLARDYIPVALSIFKNKKCSFVITRHIMIKPKNTFLHKMVFKRANCVICVSADVCKVLSEIPDLDKNKIVLINNGIDIKKFEEAKVDNQLNSKFNLPENSVIIGVIGKLAPHKGQEILIKAAPHIMKEFPDVRIAFVGDSIKDNESYLQYLKELSIKLGNIDKVHFAGFIDDISGIIKSFKISVVPSWEEPFGLSIIESMAAKIPVVSTNAGGAKEIIQHGENGLLAVPKDPESLAENIIRLLKDSSLYDNCINNGFATVKDRFSIVKMVDETIKIYEKIHAEKYGCFEDQI